MYDDDNWASDKVNSSKIMFADKTPDQNEAAEENNYKSLTEILFGMNQIKKEEGKKKTLKIDQDKDFQVQYLMRNLKAQLKKEVDRISFENLPVDVKKIDR